MTLQEDITAINDRISRAESARNAWRAAGREEKYLEAYFLVEALEAQLAERLRQRVADLPR